MSLTKVSQKQEVIFEMYSDLSYGTVIESIVFFIIIILGLLFWYIMFVKNFVNAVLIEGILQDKDKVYTQIYLFLRSF